MLTEQNRFHRDRFHHTAILIFHSAIISQIKYEIFPFIIQFHQILACPEFPQFFRHPCVNQCLLFILSVRRVYTITERKNIDPLFTILNRRKALFSTILGCFISRHLQLRLCTSFRHLEFHTFCFDCFLCTMSAGEDCLIHQIMILFSVLFQICHIVCEVCFQISQFLRLLGILPPLSQ